MASNITTCPVYPLSPLDHLSPRTHVPKLLYFSTSADPERLKPTLRSSLERSVADLPILTGSVALLKDDKVQTGSLAVQAPYCTVNDILSFNDLRKQYNFADLREREFPTDGVAAEDVAPDATNNSTRVMLVRVSFITGGVIIAVAIHHSVMDEGGIFATLRLWSFHCNAIDGNESHSNYINGAGPALVNPEWTDRTELVNGKGTGRIQDHPEYKLRTPEDSATKPGAPTEYVSESEESVESAILFFADAELERLKVMVSEQVEKVEESASWISTNDALCALIWASVTAARVAGNIQSAQPYTLFAMAVDGRTKLCPPMPPAYTGNMILVSKAVDSYENLAAIAGEPQGLARAAQLIRSSLQAIDDAMIRDVIAMVQGVDDIGRFCPGGYSSHHRNLGCSSWSRQDYYSLDWGQTLGRRCQRLRWRKLRSDGLFVIFPRIPTGFESEYGAGGLEVCLALEKGTMGLLRKNDLFSGYAHWRCT
jgi:hypothetical protein